jgi:thiol:disulfide interchange protein
VRYQPSSWLDQLVGACAGLLVAAVAIYVAVRLIEAVLVPLLLITILVAVVIGFITIIRWRRQGW